MSDSLNLVLGVSLLLNVALSVSVWYMTKYMKRDIENIAISIGLTPSLKKK